jgi:S-adenosylmethionine synthetase
LIDLHSRQQQTGTWLANDTSCGVGYAPLSPLERAVLEVEHRLNSRQIKQSHPAIGEDIKVLGIRCRGDVRLTLACAMVDRYLHDLEAYLAQTAEAGRLARQAAEPIVERPVQVDINAADEIRSGKIYWTVTGTSAEAGDDGQVGRGNRANGLITPYRPMVMEAVAGKNPVTHVGKIYNVVARRIAEAIVRELSEVAEAECYLVSQIGGPVCQPQIVDIKIRSAGDADLRRLEPQICAIADDELSRAGTLRGRIAPHEIELY